MKKIFLILFCIQSAFSSDLCKGKLFDISISLKTSPLEVLEDIASECSFSIIYADKNAKNSLANTQNLILNFKNQKFENILKIISDGVDLEYEIKNSHIKITSVVTKTFHINYVATSRIGSSNTDVIFSQDNKNYLSEDYNFSLNDKFDSNKINLGSGTKIYSVDELNFWGNLQDELYEITYADEDKNPDFEKKIIINKGAGLITITAHPSQIKRVESYIKSLNEKIQAQVLIDVNILTILHNDIDTAGVNWSEFYKLGLNQNSQNILSFSKNSFNYGINIFPQELSIGKIIEFLNTYGKVSSVSNPKVLTLNNQPAIISVGNILRYTQNLVYQNSTNTNVVQNTGEQFPSIFSGVLLDVTPSINNEYVILKINPSITSTKDAMIENEPNALKTPPNLSTNQLSSIVKLENNQKVILGGLIHKTHSVLEKRVPILGYIPLLKYLFSYKKQINQTQEMIIIISPKIIASNITPKDLGYERINE